MEQKIILTKLKFFKRSYESFFFYQNHKLETLTLLLNGAGSGISNFASIGKGIALPKTKAIPLLNVFKRSNSSVVMLEVIESIIF